MSMTDPLEPVVPVEVPADGATADAEIDPALLALFEQLRPLLTDFTATAITVAIESTPVPTVRTGTVKSFDVSTLTAQVLVDGDTTEIAGQVVCEWPVQGDRVVVQFWPPATVHVSGIVGGFGVPSGTALPFAGRITAVAPSATDYGPPRGFFWAYGQVLKQAAYPGAYWRFGTTYNTGGEASDEFRSPDMRGRSFFGLDNMGGSDAGRLSVANTLGTGFGTETHTLAEANLPSHDHSFTPSGTVSISSVTGSVSGSVSGSTSTDGSHNHGSPDGASFVTASGGLFDLGTSGVGYNINNSAGSGTSYDGSHSHTVSGTFSGSISGGGGSASFSGNAGTTGTAGSGTAVTHLNPGIVGHWIIKG